MKKILTFALALMASASLMATDVTGTNIYRYVYTDYATGDPYYSLQISDDAWNTYYFGFKSVNGPMVGQTYTLTDMLESQTYVSINYGQDAITELTFNRSYEGLQEKFIATFSTQSGAQYKLTWAAQVPAEMGADVDLDTTIVCDFRDNGAYKTFTPLVSDYTYYSFTIAFTGDMPIEGETKLYKWKNNSVYIGNASFSLPNDWNTKPFDAQYEIKGIAGGWEGTAEYSMTDGHKYIFNFTYTIPVAKETVNLSGYDLKINNWGSVVFAWQNGTYSTNLAITSADTLGNWKGNDIILGNCSFQQSATYTDLGVYAIDSIYVTKTEEGYIRLQSSILCKNNTLYVLDVTNQESPYYVKYDIDGTGVKWNYFPAADYGTGRAMGLRFNNDSIWFNTQPTDEGADGYSIKAAYGSWGDPLWEKDSINIAYDPNSGWSKFNVYMSEKYYDAILDVELSSRSYENVDGDGVWNYSFGYGSYMEGNHYSFNFGIYGPITAPVQNNVYTLNNMTEDYRTKGYDPDYNEILYDVVTLNRYLDWSANEAEKITVNVHTTDGKAYQLIYAAAAIPVATDTIEFAPIKADIRQYEYYFQFEGEGVANEANYRFQIALEGEEVTPTTFYWKQNSIYKPGTIIYNSTTGNYVDIADGWVQVDAIWNELTQVIGFDCEAYFLGYDGHCYHANLKYTIPVAEDTIAIECKDLVISNYGQNNINYGAFNNEYRVNINIATADTLGIFRDEVKAEDCSVALNYTPFTSAQGYSVDSIAITKDENGIIHLTGGILCKNNVYYSIHLTTEVTPYYLGVANEAGTVEWFDMVQGFYNDGRASGAWDIDAVVYDDNKVFVNTTKEADGNEMTFPFETMSKADGIVIEKYDTVTFEYNVYFKEVYATGIKKYVPQTGLNDARYETAPAIKRLENGNVIIERYGRKYNVLGF